MVANTDALTDDMVRASVSLFDRVWAKNSMENSRVPTAGGLSLIKGKGKGRPCFLVGAGPSLLKNVGSLKMGLLELSEMNPMVVAVDRAFPALYDSGIVPNLVVSVDPSEETLSFFRNRSTEGILLVANSTCCPRTVLLFDARIVYCTGGDVDETSEAECISRDCYPHADRINLSPGLVGGEALAMVDLMDCDPIIFVGYDCSRALGPGVGYTGGEHQPGLVSLISLRRWIEEVGIPAMKKRRPDARFWNCTEGGILGLNVEKMPVADAVTRLRKCQK